MNWNGISVKARSVFVLKTALLLCNVATAQFSFTILNESTRLPVEDALCVAQQLPGKKEVIAFTNAQGKVKLPFAGSCYVQIKKLGFEARYATLQLTADTVLTLRPDNLNLKDVVVTGQYAPVAQQLSVNTVKTINRQKIDEMGAVNLRDVLTNQLNVRINQDNVLGAGASINGIAGQNIKILIDGVPVIGRMDGTIDLTQINLSNIERIELVEGPMSVVYGSDALGGVINLISKRKVSNTISGALNGYYESRGTYNADARLTVKHKGVEVVLNGGRNFFDGYSPNYRWQQRTMQWKPRTQYFTDNSVAFKVKQSSHVVFGRLFTETITNRGAPTITPYEAYGFDEYYRTRRWGVGAQSDVYLKGNNQLQLIQSFSHFRRVKNTYRKNLVTGNSEITPTAADHDTTAFYQLMFRGVWTNTKFKKLHQQGGYDFNIETGTGQRLEGNRQTIQDYALFYTLQYMPITKVAIKAGVRGSYNTRYGTPVVPSFNFKADITNTVALRLSYAHGFRAPSLKELSLFFVDINHNIQGNPKLKAERSHNVQAEVSYRPQVKDFRFTLTPSFFYNHLYNMISLALSNPATQLYTYVNIDKFETTGFNVTGNITHKYFEWQTGFAYTGRYNSLSAATNTPRYTWAPELSSALSVHIPKINTTVAAFYKFNGAIPGFAVDENNQPYQTAIQSYSMLDASVTVRIWKERFTLSGGAKNLLNVKNINYNVAGGGAHSGAGSSMSIAMGITGFVSLKMAFTNNFKRTREKGS